MARDGERREEMRGGFEATIGLEVHLQLATRTKLFCRCPHRFGAEPNTLVCAICLGYPGTLPSLSGRAVELALRLARALGARVPERSRFARKSYFYPDLPKGFQITQTDEPLALGGALPLVDPREPPVPLVRLHLEEDAGRLVTRSGWTGVDLNRAGVPLVELLTEPTLRTPEEARESLKALRELVRHLGVSDGNLEEGSLRCDANVSVRERGTEALGTRVEIKNLNSFRFVARALAHEIERQAALLGAGKPVVPETRSWDDRAGRTKSLRGKETADEYRYLPEPDLPPLVVERARLERIDRELPELPWARRRRYVEKLGLAVDAAADLAADPALADYFDRTLAAREGEAPALAREVAGAVRGELLRLVRVHGVSVAAAARALPPARLARVLELVEAGEVSDSAAPALLDALWGSDATPEAVVERLGLGQVQDDDRLVGWIEATVAAHPAEVTAFRAGRRQLLGFFVGRAMERSGGRADPRRLRALLEERMTPGDRA